MYPFCCCFPGSLCGGVDVRSGEYRDALKEFMDICMLCNDSGLDYNEVSRGVVCVCRTSSCVCVGRV